LCSPQGNLDPPVAKEIEATQEHLEVNVLVFVGDTAAASAEDNKKAVTDATVQAFGGILVDDQEIDGVLNVNVNGVI
jgi:hypothetical protein